MKTSDFRQKIEELRERLVSKTYKELFDNFRWHMEHCHKCEAKVAWDAEVCEACGEELVEYGKH